MYKKILLAAIAAATLSLAAPVIATAATSVPDLPSGDDQAYLADGDGNPEHATINASGILDMISSTGLIITCQYTKTVTQNDDGTAQVTAFNALACTTNVPGCTASVVAGGLNWGARLGSGFVFSLLRRFFTNASVNVTLGAGCPVSGTFTITGLISPGVSVSGGVAHFSYGGASSGSMSGPIGTVTFSGTLTSSSGVGSDTQLIS